ncbi:metaxin-1 homolog [Anopheles darlingi]|uniref:metaxin-1 homolog n=1 Tax=Anopheles darlingi TaxID=43151 RepID=UPI0021000116|nr:metaxin-1 homolog [Anopheles darlingi]
MRDEMEVPMEVFVYKGEWGLPSIDYECSRLLTYLKFAGASGKVIVHYNGNPFSSPNGLLPYLIADGRTKIAGYGPIVEYLTAHGIAPLGNGREGGDFSNSTLISGHIQYVVENMHPYFMYSLWGDPKNVDTTRTLYAKRIPVPFNFYCPRKYVHRTNDLTQSLAGFTLEDSLEFHDVSELADNARRCLNWIAEKLQDNRWFLGNERPSEVDALLYGYLSVLSKLTLPNNALQNHIRQCPKLVQFVDRTTATYFAKEGFNSFTANGGTGQQQQQHKQQQQNDSSNKSSPNEPSSSSSSSSKSGEGSSKGKGPSGEQPFYNGQQQDPDDGPKERRKRYILSGLVASVAMIGYAILNGILTLPSEGNYGNFIQYDDSGDYDEDDN